MTTRKSGSVSPSATLRSLSNDPPKSILKTEHNPHIIGAMGDKMKLTDFKALSFDCYGTLIDWEKGILTSLQPLLQKTSHSLSEDAVLEAYAVAESAQEVETPTLRYSGLALSSSAVPVV